MIDQSLLKYLSDESQTRLKALEEMFDTAGWKLFQEHMIEKTKLTKAEVFNASTWEDNRLLIGALGVLNGFLAMKDSVVNEFTALAEANKEVEEEAIIDDELDYE